MFDGFYHRFAPKLLPLTRYEYEIADEFAVTDEGLLEHLIDVLGAGHRYCIEFGAGDGHESLAVRHLIAEHGFSALLIEGDPELAERMHRRHAGNDLVRTVEALITRENIEEILDGAGVPDRIGFLLIDIDGNDYHIWKAIERVRPRVLCIEYNASYRPPRRFVIDYEEDFCWAGDDYHGASMQSLVELGRDKGYELIHCKAGGDSLYFVEADLLPLFDIPDNSPEAMYQVPQMGRWSRCLAGKGHPASPRTTPAWRRAFYLVRYYLMYPLRRMGRRRFREILAANWVAR